MALADQYTVSSTVRGLFDIPGIAAIIRDANWVRIQVQSNTLRYLCAEGANPTTSFGEIVSPGVRFDVTSKHDISNFRFCRDGTDDCVIFVHAGR